MKQSVLAIIANVCLCSLDTHAFTMVQQKTPLQRTILKSTEDEGDKLILGADVGQALNEIGNEAGYLDAARKRNEEGKAKLMEQVRLEEEEAERKRKEREAKGAEGNYGPGDLSAFKGFGDDGFKASEGNDAEGGWTKPDEPEEDEEGDGDDEPKLFLFGDEDGDADAGGLIL